MKPALPPSFLRPAIPCDMRSIKAPARTANDDLLEGINSQGFGCGEGLPASIKVRGLEGPPSLLIARNGGRMMMSERRSIESPFDTLRRWHLQGSVMIGPRVCGCLLGMATCTSSTPYPSFRPGRRPRRRCVGRLLAKGARGTPKHREADRHQIPKCGVRTHTAMTSSSGG